MSTTIASKLPPTPAPLLSPERLDAIWKVIRLFGEQYRREEEKANQNFS
jgi:hypothetical protein